jgi:hypothetical protein
MTVEFYVKKKATRRRDIINLPVGTIIAVDLCESNYCCAIHKEYEVLLDLDFSPKKWQILTKREVQILLNKEQYLVFTCMVNVLFGEQL